MKRQIHYALRPKLDQRGAAAVEFALVSMVFFMLLIGAMEFGRLLYYWNVTAEATRLGARLAVVCDYDAGNDSVSKTRMTSLFPVLAPDDIEYECNNSCETVTLRINAGKSIPTVIPWVSLSPALPPFTTTLTREYMTSSYAGTPNPVCQ